VSATWLDNVTQTLHPAPVNPVKHMSSTDVYTHSINRTMFGVACQRKANNLHQWDTTNMI